MPKTLRLKFLQIFVCVTFLPGCSGMRLQTPGEVIDQIKSMGKYNSEKSCSQYLPTSNDYKYCQQEVRKVYDEVDGHKKMTLPVN